MATVVTERDRHLCGVISEVKWIGVEGVKRLLPGRAEPEIRSALARLMRGPRELLRSERVFGRRGPETLYSLTEAGLVEAAELLDREVEPAPREFNQTLLEHHSGLVELYLGLLTHSLPAAMERKRLRPDLSPNIRKHLLSDLFARAAHPTWRWTMSASARLEWKAYVSAASPRQDKYILPDATVEFPKVKVRAFVEYETGENPLVAHGQKPNATLNKLQRYAQYLGWKDPMKATSWYGERFPDGFHPYLLFVERSARRVETTKEVVKAWESKEWHGRPPLRVRVHTVDECVRRFVSWTGSEPEATPERTITLTSREASALLEGVQSLRNQSAASRLPWPPPGLKREQSFAGVLQRLSER